MDCIFCKIADKIVPSSIVYEDDHLLAFLDIFPFTRGHTLIIPKKHIPKFHDAPPELVSIIFQTAQKLGIHITSKLKANSFNTLVIGDDVPHFHVHILPRYPNDGIHFWDKMKVSQNELQALARELHASF